jgi:hypothetical protein
MASDRFPPSRERALAQDAKSRLESAISSGEKLLATYFTEVQLAIWYADSVAIIEELYGPNSSQLHTFEGNQPISVWIGAPDQEIQLEGTRKERLRNHLAALNSLIEHLGQPPSLKKKENTLGLLRYSTVEEAEKVLRKYRATLTKFAESFNSSVF